LIAEPGTANRAVVPPVICQILPNERRRRSIFHWTSDCKVFNQLSDQEYFVIEICGTDKDGRQRKSGIHCPDLSRRSRRTMGPQLALQFALRYG
jgi:hypothetical protein